jgi:archaeal flagellar protein FlaJ
MSEAGEASSPSLDRLRLSLPRAGLLLVPDVYARRVRRATVAVLVVSMAAGLALVGLAWGGLIHLTLAAQATLLLLPLAAALLAYRLGLVWPELLANVRATRIEGQLPYAVNYLSTMSSGGMSLERMFAQLAAQDVYGPIAQEARLVHRDLSLLGLDIVAAMRAALDRSPSVKFQDFLQGLLTTVTSGGDLRLFLEAKSDQYFAENRALQARFLEQLSLLAEVFVVVVVATPLLIIVLLSVLSLFGRSGPEVLVLGYALVILALPIAHAAFASTVRLMQPEG